MHSDNLKPCDWGRVSEITRRYHDEEWGMPVRDDRRKVEAVIRNARMFIEVRRAFGSFTAGYSIE